VFVYQLQVLLWGDLFHLLGQPAYLEPCGPTVSQVKVVLETSNVESHDHIDLPVVRDDVFEGIAYITLLLTTLQRFKECFGIPFVRFKVGQGGSGYGVADEITIVAVLKMEFVIDAAYLNGKVSFIGNDEQVKRKNAFQEKCKTVLGFQ